MNTDPNKLNTRRLTDFAQVETLYKTRLKKDFARNELKPLISTPFFRRITPPS